MKSMSAQQRISIVLDLRDTVRIRLLHLGAETDLIITFYSAATQGSDFSSQKLTRSNFSYFFN